MLGLFLDFPERTVARGEKKSTISGAWTSTLAALASGSRPIFESRGVGPILGL